MTLSPHIPPFKVVLNALTENNVIECEQLLRDLPGKRTVYKGSRQQQPVVIKLFLDPQGAHRHWAREKAGVEALMAASVVTPELLFSGTLDDGTPVLVFDFIPEAQTALEEWNNLTTVESKTDFLCQLVEMVGALHEAGLEQEDLHLENFLVSGQQLYAIDGDGVIAREKESPLDFNVSTRNLALFYAQLPPKYDFLMETTVLRYAEVRNMSAPQLLEQLQLELPKARRRRSHKYLKKCYRTCSEFVHLRTPGQIAVSRRDMQGETLGRLLDDPDAFMHNGVTLKAGNSSTVVRVQVDDCDWVIKRYNIKSLWHALSRGFRPTRAWVSWGNAHLLKIAGIATPQAVAMIEKRIGPLRSTGYYVCDFVAGLHADAFFYDDTVDAFVKKQTAENFVHLFELFHQLNICHGDCKATNFLLRDNEPWVLDLDAMQECLSPERFKKLAYVDRERFLRNWKTHPELLQWFDDHLPQ